MQSAQYGENTLPDNDPPRPPGQTGLIVLLAALLMTAAVGLAIYLTPVDPEPKAAADRAAPAPPTWSQDKARPYLGTPAHDWAEGEAGIDLPEPEAIGGFTAEQVGTALGKVKEYLVASRVNRAVLTGDEMEPVYATLSTNLRDVLRNQLRDNPAAMPSYATKIAPEFRLLPGGPKITGTIWAEPGAQKGELLIRTNMVYAYAFDVDDPRRATQPIDTVSAVRMDNEFLYRDGRTWGAGNRGIDAVRGQGFFHFSACSQAVRGRLAPAYSGRTPGTADAANASFEYFDPAAPIPDQMKC
ncbi:hypothetical protein [Amycolatopsis sp. 195334CR]|uniref:hypothetical protein n=1 Tax=Amycolatopsis sp. 195334CR TaxID=2814588 RepID=UPI001A8F2AA3|nr:hypothetical protein [Amycolatopsis sp. 195334CR]MBN6037768.1 hypothetical protein [Amycolatopsis sp. 195334CR]